jgi:hypothetical protein
MEGDIEDEESSSCKDSSEPYSVDSVCDPSLDSDQKDSNQSNIPRPQDLSTSKNLFSKIIFKPFLIPNLAPKETGQSNSINGQSFESFEECHEHILSEAKKALKSAKEMASMQMQLEKQHNKARKVLGFNTMDTEDIALPHVNVTREFLLAVNKKQISEMITQLSQRTDNLNAKLLKLLEERDELNMEQDSLLMDIEDLTRFIHSQDL